MAKSLKVVNGNTEKKRHPSASRATRPAGTLPSQYFDVAMLRGLPSICLPGKK